MPSTSYEPVTGEPAQGGDLIVKASPDNVGGSNYVTKRDWRRVLDAEARREGHIKFAPNEDADVALQSQVPNGETINLIHFARKPNGKTAIIVGTPTTLYRYFSFEDGGVFDSSVYDVGVFEDLSGQWLTIGTNFFTFGTRWEACDVAGKTVINNGVDLPVVYDLDWLEVRPLYQLREQGVAFVGTIAEMDGMLLTGDIAELTDAGLSAAMVGRAVGFLAQTGTTVTAGGATFFPDDVGKTLVFSISAAVPVLITEYISSTSVTVNKNQSVAINPGTIALRYGKVYDPLTYSRTQYKILQSNIGDPEDFAATYPTSYFGSGTTLTIDYGVFSLNVGDEITIPGGAEDGAALQTTITSISPQGNVIGIADPTLLTEAGSFQRTSALSSVSSAYELQDDGSAIIRMIELQGHLAVLKEKSIFVGTLTGAAGAPLAFQKVYAGPDSIGWKWMLQKVNGRTLVYAGVGSFFTFDLTTVIPRAHPKLSLCQSLFFDEVVSLSQASDCWAADNVLTGEVWFVFPSSTADKAICYDYIYNTCSTTSAVYTSGASVQKPLDGTQVGIGEDRFLLGNSSGHVFQYGLTNFDQGTFSRDGVNYDSVLKAGMFGEDAKFDEQDLRNYVLHLSRFSGTPISVTLYGTKNAHETPATLFARTISAPTNKNLIPTYYRKNYYQDELKVTGASTNAAIVRRVLEFSNPDSRSTVRNNTI